MKTGIELIAAERQRQIEKEGWAPEHDDKYDRRQLARAAQCYQMDGINAQTAMPSHWPWSQVWWKPSNNPERNLVRAGALFQAQIDRQKRLGVNLAVIPVLEKRILEIAARIDHLNL